ncbi:hypothetical protein, partial [Burkholderia cenocepacia]|uniref:hypothetical protein n=1 Tax=Burkholderia cenocepacia TaxID=95486 RepID=UPI00406CFF2E
MVTTVETSDDANERGIGATVTAEGGSDRAQGMIIVDGRRGHEDDTRGGNNTASALRTTSDPEDVYWESVLGKLVLT